MCPATLALAASASSAVGGGIAAGQTASYQAAVASNNATIARQNEVYSAQAGATQTEQSGLKARAQDAGVKAGLAANNVDVNTGSAADVQQSEHEINQFDTATVAHRAAMAVYGYHTQVNDFSAQSKLDQAQVIPDYLGGFLKAGGSVASTASENPAATSLLSGAPSVPSQYQWMTTPGSVGEGNADTYGLNPGAGGADPLAEGFG